MAGPTIEPGGHIAPPGHAAFDDHTLVDAFVRRRSRRFALGHKLVGSGLAYESSGDARSR